MKQRWDAGERHALQVVGMSASALRTCRPDGNVGLRQQIMDMAQRYRRYGANDLPQAAPGWTSGQSQACRTAIRAKNCRFDDVDARRSPLGIASR